MPIKLLSLIFISICGALIGACSGDNPTDTSLTPPAQKILALQTIEGDYLSTSYYPPLGTEAPGVILVHGFARTHQVWDSIAVKLQSEGYSVIAFDLRGHGESAGNNEDSRGYQGFSLDTWLEMSKDIGIAKEALIVDGNNPGQIAIIGEELGASLALLYAMTDPEIAALVLLSPGLKYKGVESKGLVTRLSNRPLLLMTGEQDAYAASSARALHAEAPGYVELRTYPGSARGSDLLVSSPVARNDLLHWLKQHFMFANTSLD